jgi:uncharacterized protein YabE (DUF348 family)
VSVLSKFWLAVAGLLLGLALAVIGVNLAFAKQVVLTVDGDPTRLTVVHANVAEVLAAQGIVIGPHDQVYPAMAATVSNGLVIDVKLARPIDLVLDGRRGRHWTTSTTVGGILAELGLVFDEIKSSHDPDAAVPLEGLTLTVDPGQAVSVTADGAVQPLRAHGTVADALLQAGLEWDADDLISPPAEQRLSFGLTINLVRVEVRPTTRQTDLPFETEYQDDDSLYRGQTQVTSRGQVGQAIQEILQTFHDGQLVSEVVTSQRTTRPPVTQTALRGTQAPPAVALEGVWAALAKCESGGNPRTNTGNGYYGLYQFSLRTWQGVGGSGLPSDASAEEQTARAQILQARSGWGQWPGCARRLGLL